VELLDLSDLDSVRAFGKKAQQESQPLDVLLNNAGAARCCLITPGPDVSLGSPPGGGGGGLSVICEGKLHGGIVGAGG